MRALKIVLASMLLSGCAGNQLTAYRNTTPPLQFDQFFSGPLKGHGLVQDRSGKVIKRFDVDMYGVWRGDQGTLAEHFVYYDGKIVDRAWHLRKLADNRFVGRASDIVGDAPGHAEGSAIRWNYVMEVPTDNGKVYDVTFDDWMYQMHDNTILNRNDMSKLGVGLGTVTVVEQKQPPGTKNLAYGLIGKK